MFKGKKSKKLNELARKIIAESEKDLSFFRSLKLNWNGVQAIAHFVSTQVEWISIKEKVDGSDKRDLAVEISLMLLEKYVPSGWVSLIPKFALRWIVGKLIDQAVKGMNKIAGKNWGKSLKSDA